MLAQRPRKERAKAASSARSGRLGLAAATCRRSTATSCRKISISTSFAAEDRESRTSHAKIRMAIR